ncbi:MAG: HTH domain-containing protein [Patescibacteria group bacterium]|jgi:DNA-directed RNA polymerase delta subunit
MAIKSFSPYGIVHDALSALKSNEQRVITGRFGIDSPRLTLSAIGKDLKLSRERVRQIERDGLKKLAGTILESHKDSISKIVDTFAKNGGISVNHKIADKFLEDAYKGDPNQFNSLALIFFIMPQLKKVKKTRELEDSWIMAELSRSEAIKVINDWVEHLEKIQKPQSLDVLLKVHPHHNKYEITFLSELPSISKRVIKTEDNMIGLASWAEVNPRNIRDKIFYILKKANKPLHFEEIANRIKSQEFDKKKVVKATVHNELIADNRFVLVGRGVYALREWGYKPGTVSEIISSILEKNKSGMRVDEIVKEVLKQRVVKKNTILINLKTKDLFKKVAEDCYSLA